MKLKISAFMEDRRPLNEKDQQPTCRRFIAKVEVESRAPGTKEVSASIMEGVASGIDSFLDPKKFKGAKDFGCRYEFSISKKTDQKITFTDGDIMVERSMLGPDEISQVIRAVDTAITRGLTQPKEQVEGEKG
jgi:hypothetical protein